MTSVLSRAVTPLKGVVGSSIIGAALTVFAFAAPAMAAPIDYTLTGTGSGTLNGQMFTDDPFTINLLADTTGISPLSGAVDVNGGPATVTVDSLPTATLVNAAAAVNRTVGVAGFASTTGSNLFFATNAAFTTYALGFIDPTTGPAFAAGTASATFGTTTGGTFTITPTVGSEATFSAVPLPAALPLFGSGLGALGLFGWRRKRRAQAVA